VNILVAGGAGYIGSHCCKMLASRGYHPVVLDNLSTGSLESVKWGTFIQGEVGDRKVLDSLFLNYDIKGVMHFAAFAYVGESVKSPAKYYANNVAQTATLLEAMVDHEVKNFIFSSSAATYGNPCNIPISESHPQRPINPYGHTKLMVEQMLRDFDAAYGFPHVSLRYFNAAGADNEGEIGERHDPETHLIPLILQTILGIRDCLSIYGTDYQTADGTCVRDYIHVTDLCSAHILALEWLLDGNESEVFNLGNERGYSVKEVIALAEKVTGLSVKTAVAPRRAGDPPVLISSSSRIKETLGWRPEHSEIENILRTAWRWERKWRGLENSGQR
jgi:UDP-glucose 4-epimerase